MIKYKVNAFKFFSICFGFTLSFFIFEIIARIAPATSVFPLERPIKCDLNKKINLNCLQKNHIQRELGPLENLNH